MRSAMISDCHLRSDCVLDFFSAMTLSSDDMNFSRAAFALPPPFQAEANGGSRQILELVRVTVAVTMMMVVLVVVIVRLGDLAFRVADHQRVDHAAQRIFGERHMRRDEAGET